MKYPGISISLGIAGALLATTAFAQATPATNASPAAGATAPTPIAAGSPVRDSKGVQVGTLVSSDASKVVIDTGQAKVGVPMSFVTSDSQGAKLKITADQFNQALAKAHAREAAQQQTPAAQSTTPPAQPQPQ